MVAQFCSRKRRNDAGRPRQPRARTDCQFAKTCHWPKGDLRKIAIGGPMIVEAFHERLIARSKAVARP
jgi:hypothetical protein